MHESFSMAPAGDTVASLSPFDGGDSFSKFGNPGDLSALKDNLTIADNNKHIEWAHSLADGVKQAQAEGKPLVCIFEESGCGWCKKFDQELSKPAADAVGGDAIFVKIRPSSDADGQTLANNLGINSYPTVSIIDVTASSFNERRRLTGFMSASEFADAFKTGPQTSASTMIA